MLVTCLLCCRFFDRPVVPLPPPPEAWQHHPPVEPPPWGRAMPPEFPPRFLPPPEVPLVSKCLCTTPICTAWCCVYCHINCVLSVCLLNWCTKINIELKSWHHILVLNSGFSREMSCCSSYGVISLAVINGVWKLLQVHKYMYRKFSLLIIAWIPSLVCHSVIVYNTECR